MALNGLNLGGFPLNFQRPKAFVGPPDTAALVPGGNFAAAAAALAAAPAPAAGAAQSPSRVLQLCNMVTLAQGDTVILHCRRLS